MNEEVARSVALAATSLGALHDGGRRFESSQDFALPLLALGLRREHEGAKRLFCMPVHSSAFLAIAGRNPAFAFLADLRPHHFASKFYGREPKTTPDCRTIYLKLYNWLLSSFDNDYYPRKVFDSKVKFPGCLAQAKDLLCLLAHHALPDNDPVFLLCCTLIQSSCVMLKLGKKQVRYTICCKMTSLAFLLNVDPQQLLVATPSSMVQRRIKSILEGNSFAETLERAATAIPTNLIFFRLQADSLVLDIKALIALTTVNEPHPTSLMDWYEPEAEQIDEDIHLISECLKWDCLLRDSQSICASYGTVNHLLEGKMQPLEGPQRHPGSANTSQEPQPQAIQPLDSAYVSLYQPQVMADGAEEPKGFFHRGLGISQVQIGAQAMHRRGASPTHSTAGQSGPLSDGKSEDQGIYGEPSAQPLPEGRTADDQGPQSSDTQWHSRFDARMSRSESREEAKANQKESQQMRLNPDGNLYILPGTLNASLAGIESKSPNATSAPSQREGNFGRGSIVQAPLEQAKTTDLEAAQDGQDPSPLTEARATTAVDTAHAGPADDSPKNEWQRATESLVAAASAFSNQHSSQNLRDALERTVQGLASGLSMPLQQPDVLLPALAAQIALQLPSKPSRRSSPEPTASTTSRQPCSKTDVSRSAAYLPTANHAQAFEADEGIADQSRKRGAPERESLEGSAKKARQGSVMSQSPEAIQSAAVMPIMEDRAGTEDPWSELARRQQSAFAPDLGILQQLPDPLLSPQFDLSSGNTQHGQPNSGEHLQSQGQPGSKEATPTAPCPTVLTERIEEWKSLQNVPQGKYLEMIFQDAIPMFRVMSRGLESAIESPKTHKLPVVGNGIDEGDVSFDSLLEMMTDTVKAAIDEVLEGRRKIAESLEPHQAGQAPCRDISEIVLDDCRHVVLHFLDGTHERLSVKASVDQTLKRISGAMAIDPPVTVPEVAISSDIMAVAQLKTPSDLMFTADNRLGIPGTLHRISALRNRSRKIIGLTCRVGRHIPGGADLLTDILAGLATGGASMLLLGPPGVGKTTLLRDIVRMLADRFDLGSRVMVVDTSNEIGGDGDIPHPAIGSARRLQVQSRATQHQELQEAVQNHNPKVLVVDEIGNQQEATALQGVGHRGAVMVGTAHGISIHDLIKNPELSLLLGGLSEVTVGDRQARMNSLDRKTRLERRGSPVFQILVEVLGFNKLHIHMDTAASVDAILNRKTAETQERQLRNGKMVVAFLGRHYKPFFEHSRVFRGNKRGRGSQAAAQAAVTGQAEYERLAPLQDRAADDPFGGVIPRSSAPVVPKDPVDPNSLEYLSRALPRIVQGRR